MTAKPRSTAPKDSTATIGSGAAALRGIANLKPRGHLAGLLRSERQFLTNPPFNDSDTALRGSAFLQSEAKPQFVSEAKDNFRKDDDVRWQWSGARSTAKGSPQGERGGVHQFGVPPKGNANLAWVQHFVHHLAPQAMAGFVLAKGSMASNQPGEGTIRQALIEADLVDCMVALPGQLFYSTQIPACLWIGGKMLRDPRKLAHIYTRQLISHNSPTTQYNATIHD